MKIFYEAAIEKVRPKTAEEKKAVKVLEYRELPEENKSIREYAEIASRAYAKTALYLLFLELKQYAFENHCKHLNVEIMVGGVDHIKAMGTIGNDANWIITLTAAELKFGPSTPTIQECIFNGIYGESAKAAYMQQIRDSLKEFGEPRSLDDIHSYQDVTIVFFR